MGFLLPVRSRLILCHSPMKTPIVRALKKAGRHKAEGDSDGLAGCAVSRPCPPGVELAQGVTTSAATCRKANGEPPVTERGTSTEHQEMPDDSMRSNSADRSTRAGLGGASSKNAPRGMGYMLDAARYCGGQRTHGNEVLSAERRGGIPTESPRKCGQMRGSCGHLRAFLAGITKKSLGVTRPSVTSTSSWIVSKSGFISPLRMRVTVLTARPIILARSVAVILLRVRYWSNVIP